MTDITITLPDGATRAYPSGTTGGEVAADISKSLAKKAFAVKVDGALDDLSRPLTADHALAQEIWPDTKVTIGPVIENGFYYDFDRAEPFSSEDLEKIEAKMREIIALKDPVSTTVWDRAKAIGHYTANGEPYKVELIEGIPGDEPLRMYWHGYWQDAPTRRGRETRPPQTRQGAGTVPFSGRSAGHGILAPERLGRVSRA